MCSRKKKKANLGNKSITTKVKHIITDITTVPTSLIEELLSKLEEVSGYF